MSNEVIVKLVWTKEIPKQKGFCLFRHGENKKAGYIHEFRKRLYFYWLGQTIYLDSKKASKFEYCFIPDPAEPN